MSAIAIRYTLHNKVIILKTSKCIFKIIFRVKYFKDYEDYFEL